MRKQTTGEKFAAIRRQHGATMIQIALKCGLSETVVWHLEHNLPIRWETVHSILTVGLGIPQGTRDYESMHALWLKERQERAESKPEAAGKRALSKHATEATRKFRNLVRDLDPVQTKKVLMAAEKSARSL